MRISLAQKIFAGYIVIISLTAFIGIYSVVNLYSLSGLLNSIVEADISLVRMSSSLLDLLMVQYGNDKKFSVLREKDFLRLFEEGDLRFSQILNDIRRIDTERRQSVNLKEIEALHASYSELFHRKSDHLLKMKTVWDDNNESENLFNDISSKIKTMIIGYETSLIDKMKQSDEMTEKAKRTITLIFIYAIVLSLIITAVITYGIRVPLKRLRDATSLLSDGDFDHRIEISSRDEIGDLTSAFNIMSRKLKEIDQMKADFISYASHELRTPMTSLKEAVALMMDRVPGDLTEKQGELLKIINEDCDRLLKLINDLLDLSKLESGLLPLNIQDSRIEDVVEKTLSAMRPIAESKGVYIGTDLGNNIPKIPMDGFRIQQVLTNLLSNAIKFTNSGGRIGITLYKEKEDIIVKVSDTGEGIPKDALGRIFDKFHQLGDKKTGTGLGLPIVKHIVEAHGGRIWAESEQGKGSIFYFTIPLMAEK
ncbi:MAG: HAMP domain-containing sensor histidine kinase [Nitrospirota bacterium]